MQVILLENIHHLGNLGDVVKVNSVAGNWAHITVGGRSGHVSVKYLSF